MKVVYSLAALGLAVGAPAYGKDPDPLFQSSEVIRITFKGAVNAASDSPRPASLIVGNETLPITFTERGITRRQGDICPFPPLRVTFTQPPPETSVFAKR